MADKPAGLYDLVARVQERCLAAGEIFRWLEAVGWEEAQVDDAAEAVPRLADAVLELVWQGEYARASRLANLHPKPEDYELTRGLDGLEQCPAWQQFLDACELAERIGHHPNIRIHEWCFVELELYSHNEGALTDRDLGFVEALEGLS